jgi:ribonuclease R
VKTDDAGQITAILPRETNDAHRLIEECMLAANTCAADFIESNKKPSLYRVHDSPAETRLEQLREVLTGFGLKLGGGNKPSPADYEAVVKAVQDKPYGEIVQMALLRSMQRAVYSPENIGHYGLAFPYYTHFTSPIRRYPDMMVHRLVAKYLLQSKNLCRSDIEELEEACSHSTECEMGAQAAERDSIKQMHARWISRHLGEEFDAVISGVTEFGLFVQLKDTLTEGLVPIRTISPHDYMQFDEDNYCLIAARSGKTYTLSDSVRVRVTKVDIDRKLIDFALLEDDYNYN